MKKIAFFLFLLVYQLIPAQDIDDKLVSGNINVKYLEHLIKKGIDSVRSAHNLNTLVNDSVLYIAAQHHANYLRESGKFSHDEDDKQFKNPQIRAEYYGASKNYQVGENIIKSFYGLAIKDKSNHLTVNNTYKQLANALVQGWIHSKGHFANMITPAYQVTGLAVHIDEKTKAVYAVQKFAKVLGKYEFAENKKMFSYSDYIPSPTVNSFEEVSQKLHDTKHEFGLTTMNTKSPIYVRANYLIEQSDSPLYWEIKGSSIYLVAEYNALGFLKFFENAKDGVAVEMVSYTPYDCGNPEYYTQRSRRNKQCEFSGIVLEPVYRKQLLKGFKPRRKNMFKRIKLENIKHKENGFFVNFINGIRAPYEPTSFRLKLGKIPKEAEGYNEFNLVYIKQGGIARVSHFTDMCGAYYSEFYPLNYLKEFPDSNYLPIAYEKEYRFEFLFKQGKSDYTFKDLKPLLDSLTDDAFIILSADVHAYSSVEGSENINNNLQQKRAGNLIKALQEKQQYSIKPTIATSTNWQFFKQQIDSTEALASLRNLSKEQLTDSLQNKAFCAKLEPYLAKQRKADIIIKTKYDLSDKTIGKFLINEHNRLFRLLDEKKVDELYLRRIDTLWMIQKYAYQKVKEGVLHPGFLMTFECCGKKEMYKMYNNLFCFQEEFNLNEQVKGSTLKNYFTDNSYDFAGANYLINVMKTWDSASVPKGITMDDLQKGVEGYFTSNDSILPVLPKLGLNYSFKAAEYYYNVKKYDEMLKSLAYLYTYYTKNLPDEATAVRIAKAFTRYHGYGFAVSFLKIYVDKKSTNPELLGYYAKLTYINYIENKTEEYAKWLIDIKPYFKEDEWCKLFIGNCNISFQVLDSEAFRNFYCKECAAYKNEANSPELWEEKK
ncbi:MAG: CAP domain-containing protein [Bacteroidetes bacterium]|nr:CAP domain-containing protein [Bacteroidota bacterium]